MNLSFPYAFDHAGRTAAASDPRWIAGLIEQLLLTNPGERVMRPEFGGGALALVFAPGGPELAAALRLLVEGAVRATLGNLISLDALDVDATDGELNITLAYTITATGEAARAVVAVPGAPA